MRRLGSMVLIAFLLGSGCTGGNSNMRAVEVELPEPRYESETSVEKALSERRSIRSYKEEPLTLEELAQLLWAAQGITAEWGGRTAPSAGALYPLEVYAVVGNVRGLESGVYHYRPADHSLVRHKAEDLRVELARAALGQSWIRKAPLILVIAAHYERSARKYGERANRYVHIEVGHVGQNVYLQAEALGLGTVMVGAFYDQEVKELLELEGEPLAIMPVGRPTG